jgi:hypothetical protein
MNTSGASTACSTSAGVRPTAASIRRDLGARRVRGSVSDEVEDGLELEGWIGFGDAEAVLDGDSERRELGPGARVRWIRR